MLILVLIAIGSAMAPWRDAAENEPLQPEPDDKEALPMISVVVYAEGDEDENIDYTLNFTFNKAQERPVNVALSNAFGFGGHNATVIVKKYK